MVHPTRRRMLAISAAAVASVAAFHPRAASATPDEVKKWLAPGDFAAAQKGKVTITAPEIAENGNTVPIVVAVDSPMTDANYVKTIWIAADGNPLPGVARFDLTPVNGEARVEFRIRLAQTENVIAVAQLSDGTTWTATRPVKVTIGGCGG
ncbi:MAG: thiosulfate oxidation carrier protein SoxY [Candidatus Eremiobacteraeota bacterium]|nr:thiosulfate oxidation carrier protein SoxY [Candidatus Eremiobacteraeota bacterium]